MLAVFRRQQWLHQRTPIFHATGKREFAVHLEWSCVSRHKFLVLLNLPFEHEKNSELCLKIKFLLQSKQLSSRLK